MTCHSIQINFDGAVSEADAESAIDNVLTSYDSVVPEQSSPSTNDNVIYRNTELDGSGEDYHFCLYRFAGDQSKSAILDDLETELGSVSAGWYQLKHHECYHDDEAGGACGSWVVERETGTVPSGV